MISIQEQARKNRKLLITNPAEYTRKLRAQAETFVGELRNFFIEAANKIERERC